MSKFWGPLGWATLHSASLLYSDTPSPEEKALIEKFLEAFRITISCNDCKLHFTDMLMKYRASNPQFLNSKSEFMLFVFRAHNSVNKRLDKPILQTPQDCIQTLKNMQSYSSLES